MASRPPLDRFDVISADGTRLACYRGGSGPPLVLQPGALCDHTCWQPLWPFLSPYFTLVAFDRRGRGASAAGPEYAIEREVDDLCAVLEAAGERPHLFGHSAGAILSLEAASRGAAVASLMLYEPPVPTPGAQPSVSQQIAARAGPLVAAGDPAEALRYFFRFAANLSDDDIRRLEAEPRWADQLKMVPTLLQDVEIAQAYVIDRDRLASLQLPVLLLLGEASPDWMNASVRAVASALPRARVETLAGQGHLALFSSPATLATALLRFLGVEEP